MKLLISILTFQAFTILSNGQTITSNENAPLEKYINGCMDSLDTIEYLKNHLLTKEETFCNIASCLIILEVYDEDSLLNQAIYQRLRQIAYRFIMKETPILLIETGLNSVEKSKALNSVMNSYGITYVSFGNSCLLFGSVNKGIQQFNLETKKLLMFKESDNQSK